MKGLLIGMMTMTNDNSRVKEVNKFMEIEMMEMAAQVFGSS